MHFLVGTFNLPYIYTLLFDAQAGQLNVTQVNGATAGHPWLSLAPDQRTLYASSWEPPMVTAYKVWQEDGTVEKLNTQPVASQSGYVTVSNSRVYSVGGPSGEVFPVQADGSLGAQTQSMSFTSQNNGSATDLAHGAHSIDASPDGKTLYVADIGSNGVWTFTASDPLTNQKLHPSARQDDGPRHVWPHPNGEMVYVVQEHSNFVDAFRVAKRPDGTVETLQHVQGASIIPAGKQASDYSADEVRLSTGPPGSPPKFLFTSTRGKNETIKGYVAAFALDEQGGLKSTDALDVFETPTSGGFANAIEPAPWVASAPQEVQYLALTDAADGTVHMLTFDGTRIRDLCKVALEVPASEKDKFNGTIQAATAVWLLGS